MGACCAPQALDTQVVSALDDAKLVGPPTAALCPPGQCQFTGEWSPATLAGRVQVSHDSVLLTFDLPDKSKPLGLSTCACLLCKFSPGGSADPVVRPYTPVSTNATIGSFLLLVKVYGSGKMSQHLKALPLGSSVDFKHVGFAVKTQYPFKRKHITMLAGGTGIAPMVQALHAILGTSGDDTRVTLLFGNKTSEDILCRSLLDSWSKSSKGRLSVVHVLSRLAESDQWQGARGHINRALIEKHSAPPSADVLVMVCGTPPMYSSLCGPGDQRDPAGLLAEMGYAAEQIYKF